MSHKYIVNGIFWKVRCIVVHEEDFKPEVGIIWDAQQNQHDVEVNLQVFLWSQ